MAPEPFCCSNPAFTPSDGLKLPGEDDLVTSSHPEVTRRDDAALAVLVTTQPDCANQMELPNPSTKQSLLLASCWDMTGLRTPRSISWKRQRGTANLFLRLYPKPLTDLKNLLCSSDMCYFPIMRN